MTVALRHVGRYGGMPPGRVVTPMTGDAFAVMEALDGRGSEPHVELTLDEVVGHGVVMAFHLDVIVDVDAGLLPFGELVRRDRQGF